MHTNHLEIAVTHLNAPFGAIVTTNDLRTVLTAGSLKCIADPRVAAILGYAFVELDPKLIVLCVNESGSDLRRADRLYRETLFQSIPRVLSWEKSVECLL